MKRQLLLLVLALQAVWIVATVAVQETRLQRGTVVLLETVPVDPRDLLRGDYVILSYKISSLPAPLFVQAIPHQVRPGTAVFVRLEKSGEFHEAQSASFSPIEGDGEHPVLRGTISHRWGPGPRAGDGSVRVEYGLERFYVREGTGNPVGKLTVEAAVPRSGKAVIRQVYVDGQPYAEVMKDPRRSTSFRNGP